MAEDKFPRKRRDDEWRREKDNKIRKQQIRQKKKAKEWERRFNDAS
jgi:hypothetical protein